MIAALYVQTGGAYFGLEDVDPWDETRDARLYAGPWAVVAHPPCARWCALAHLVELRYGYRVGDDGGTFAAALAAVRRFGGVLEHPAYSKAWAAYDLPRPGRSGWTGSFFDVGHSTEVDQHAYGFPGRKRTWLYAVGCELPELRWNIAPAGLPVVSRFGWSRPGEHFKDEHHTIRPHKASKTPAEFRDVLLDMARSALPSFDVLTVLA
jgi:hypothetical protein